MPTYPDNIVELAFRPERCGVADQENVSGRAVNFDCGSLVRFSLYIDNTGRVADVRFTSNGCGYMIAAAETAAAGLTGNLLRELHGLDENEFEELINRKLGGVPFDRTNCVAAVRESIRTAFSEFRKRQIEEFVGEKALICTCFGISEESLSKLIKDATPQTIDDMMKLTPAGSGCGSCRMLIQEMLDEAE